MGLSAPQANTYFEYLRGIPWAAYNTATAFDGVVAALYANVIRAEEQPLLQLAFKDDLTQAEVDAFLQTWDIEKYGSDKALLLSYVMKKHPALKFGAYAAPRLSGVAQYYRFKNLALLAKYHEIVGALNAAGIVPLIFKGGAMKHLRPELPRVMGDIDILLADEEQHQKACAIVQNLGYTLTDEHHSVDLHAAGSNEGVLDMHRYVDALGQNAPALTAKLFAAAVRQTVFGTQSYVPCAEDMVFLILLNLAKNLRTAASLSGIVYAAFDIAYFLKTTPDFNWEAVWQNVERTDTGVPIYLAWRFLQLEAPNLLPVSISRQAWQNDKLRSLLNKDYFFAKYVYAIKYSPNKPTLKKALQSRQELWRYVTLKPPYWLAKKVWRSPRLLKCYCRLKGI